jgi:hypothetical protein
MNQDLIRVPQTNPEREAFLRNLAPIWYKGRMPNSEELPHGASGYESILSGVKACLYKFCVAEHIKTKKPKRNHRTAEIAKCEHTIAYYKSMLAVAEAKLAAVTKSDKI